MQLVRYDANRFGLRTDADGRQVVVDVYDSLDGGHGAELRELLEDDPGAGWTALIANWDRARAGLQEILDRVAGGEHAHTQPLEAVALRAPIPSPHSHIFALGGNFGSHAADAAKKKESGLPPWGFTVLHGTIVGPGADVTPPPFVRFLDAEAEVAAIFGPAGSGPSGGPAIWGYTAWNDVSIRDGVLGESDVDQGIGYKWALGKNFSTANVCGPCVVVDEIPDEQSLRIIGRVNGEVRQDGTLDEMIFSFIDTAEFVSKYLPVSSGDIVLSGTPGGTAYEDRLEGRYLRPGDVMEVEVEPIGVLRNEVTH